MTQVVSFEAFAAGTRALEKCGRTAQAEYTRRPSRMARLQSRQPIIGATQSLIPMACAS